LPRVRGTDGRAADGICVRVLSAFATFVLLSACPALAQASSDPGIGAGAHLGFSRARDADSGFFSGGLQVRARLTGGLGIEALVSYRRETYTSGGEAFLRVQEIPLQGSVELFFLARNPIQPYILAGGGYYYVRTTALGSNTAGGHTESLFGFHVGAGVDARVAKRASVFADVRYVLLDVEAVKALPGGLKSDYVNAIAGVMLDF
jgi:outer membrane protein W